MDAIEFLKNYKSELDPVLKKYFSAKVKQADSIDYLAKQAVKTVADFTLVSGKRIRPALVYYGYLAAGGRDREEIREASMSVELIHSFLLIHDDIIDRDAKRHGIDTVHEKYRKIGQNVAPQKDSRHFGNSMAIMIGDMASAMANEIIFNAKFPPEIIIKALNKLQDIVYLTIPGEMMDLAMENRGYASEKEILKMLEEKTSRYTFEGPLHLGVILAGGDKKMLGSFSRYALPLGKAFQLQDDILGVYGDEKKMGKPVGADISEGKQTLLLVKALEKADKNQKNILKKSLGKKDLTAGELEQVREIIRQSGSLEYCRNLALEFVEESLKGLEKVDFKKEKSKEFLTGLARYIVSRDK